MGPVWDLDAVRQEACWKMLYQIFPEKRTKNEVREAMDRLCHERLRSKSNKRPCFEVCYVFDSMESNTQAVVWPNMPQ